MAGAEAPEGPLREARLLLDGRVRPGTWTGVRPTLEAGASALRGDLSAVVGPADHRQAVVVPARVRDASFLLPVFLPDPAVVPRVAFLPDGSTAEPEWLEPEMTEVPAGEILIGVDPSRAAEDRLRLPEREVLDGGRVVHWATLPWNDEDAIAHALGAVDGIVCGEPDLPSRAKRLGSLGAWLGRGGRLFRDAASARKAVAEGWGPVPRATRTSRPPLRELFPPAGASPRRLHLARVALGILLALGAAAIALVGWWRLSRGAAALMLAVAAAAGCAAVLALVPAGGLVLRGAAVRVIRFPEWTPGRVVAVETVKGFASVETVGASEPRVRLPVGRVSVAAASRTDASAGSAIVSHEEGAGEIRGSLPAGGRWILRLERHADAVESLRPRLVRLDARPIRLEYETAFRAPLTDVVLVDGANVHTLDDIPPQPSAGERRVAEKPLSWDAYLRRVGPPGDPDRALRAWWGARRGVGAWLLAVPAGDPPLVLDGGPDADVAWGPVLLAIQIVE